MGMRAVKEEFVELPFAWSISVPLKLLWKFTCNFGIYLTNKPKVSARCIWRSRKHTPC